MWNKQKAKAGDQLQYETSPYLLQHARQPVNWLPWGKLAFAKAQKENKPIFLSIGYSTCHWCHVMARQSFDDQEVADLLNRGFVAIKVDKEHRHRRRCCLYGGMSGAKWLWWLAFNGTFDTRTKAFLRCHLFTKA